MAIHTGTCPLDCPDACGLLIETDESGQLRRLRGDPGHPYTRGFLCGKTARYHELVHHGGRLTEPLVRRGSRLEPSSWEAGIGVIAERIARTRGEQILPLYYAGNEGLVARRFPMRMMHALGAGSYIGGICSSVGEAGYRLVLGEVIGPDIEEAADADALILWGVDVARTWQHMLPIVKQLCDRSVPVVAIDIYRSDTIKRVVGWGGSGLIVHPGSDSALALGLCRLAFELGFADRDFLERECLGARRFEEHVRSHNDLADTCRATGLGEHQVMELARVLGRSVRPFIKTGTGWTRRRNGGASMRAVCSLAAVLGHAERVLFESSDHFGLAEQCIERPELRADRAHPAPCHQAALGRELCNGRYEVVFVWGHNPAVTLPDSARVCAGLSRDDLFLVVHEQVMTETAQLADVVLPATFFFEHSDLYRSYGHRYLHFARKATEPPPGPRSNLSTFAAIARALKLPPATWDVTEESVVEEVLEASRERIGEANLERLRAGERVKLPPLVRTGRGTPSGKVELVSEAAVRLGQPDMASVVTEDEVRELWLCPAPSVATHNSTYLASPWHLARAGAPCCWINPALARVKGIGEGDLVRLESDHGRLTLAARISDDVPENMVRVDGLPRPADCVEGYGVNVLTGPEISDLGNGATFFSTRVDLVAVAKA
jgi:anaerobic selenocysteine-containing dehydrogenase